MGHHRRFVALLTMAALSSGCGMRLRSRALAPLTSAEQALADRLARHVDVLAGTIGPRHLGRPTALNDARRYIEQQFSTMGYESRRQEFAVGAQEAANIEVEIPGAEATRVVIGAHYDTVSSSPGADDNASGVAALLEIARSARSHAYRRTISFVAFVNEEPPWFQTERMGSVVYATTAKQRGERIAGMISLESVGYYSDAPKSQRYPAPFHLFFPNVGNFVAGVSNFGSWGLLRDVTAAFRRGSALPIIGSPAPASIPGIGWSDHWSFWREGYRAVMLTGTAPFRNPHYHTAEDRPDTIDYARLARFASGMESTIAELGRVVPSK